MAASHTVRTADGGTRTFDGYTRGFAIKAHCSECMAWETSPADCTATTCPLYPFRGKTLLTREGSKLDSEGQKSPSESLATALEGDGSREPSKPAKGIPNHEDAT